MQFYPHFDLALKTIYESTKIKIIFTSSIALELYKLGADLSRRVRLQEILLFLIESIFSSPKRQCLGIHFGGLKNIRTCEEFEALIRPYNSLFEEYLKAETLYLALM